VDSPNRRGSIAIPVLATALALGILNFGVAVLIVVAIGVRTFAPLWVGLVALAMGIAVAALAIWLWRGYVALR
jgi:hypothetical protein